MRILLNILSRMLLAVAALLAMVACRNDEPGGHENDTRLDIVTFDYDDGSASTFTMQEHEDSPLITLVAPGVTNLKLKKGERTTLHYYELSAESNYKRTIKVNYSIHTIFDTIRVASKQKIDEYTNNPIQLKSVWRTGCFININALAQYTGETRKLGLIIDESTVNNDVVDAYLIDDILDADGLFYRRALISVYTGNLWQKYHCSTLRVHINDTCYPDVEYYDFSRPKDIE